MTVNHLSHGFKGGFKIFSKKNTPKAVVGMDVVTHRN